MNANAILETAVKYLVTVNTALPVILTTIDMIALAIKGATGSGPTVAERAEIIRANISAGRQYRDEELARLDALIAAQQDPPVGDPNAD
jgi:hypothetical protein